MADPGARENAAFVEELAALLEKHDLADVPGLNAIVPERPPGEGVEKPRWLWEKTIGRANIVFTVSHLEAREGRD